MEKKGITYKIVSSITLIVGIILSVIYYAKVYMINTNLIFTSKDQFILIIFGVCISIIIAIYIITFMFFINIKNEIQIILQEIISAEDNQIEFQRNTQMMILELSKKLGVIKNQTSK